MVTKQAQWSDWGKYNTRRKSSGWGGRYSDGPLDDLKRPSYFGYYDKIRRRNKTTYYYSTPYRKRKWSSYGRKY